MSDPVSAILLRFPGPVTLHASRRKWAVILLGAAVALAMPIYFLRSEHMTGWYEKLMVLTAIAFLALGGLVAIVAMLPGAAYIKIDREGFEVANLFRRTRIAWRDAANFQASPGLGLVVFDYALQKDGMFRRMTTSMAGRNGGLPDTYGFAPADLADLMTQWRARALK